MHPNNHFRADLQGLRAVAVLLVVLAHSGIGLFSGGFIGVDVFFVLSGYLITGILFRELESSGRIDFLSFYGRRLKRLLPALLFVLLASSVAAFVLLPNIQAYNQLVSLPYAASWTSNLHFAFTSIEYFDEFADRDLFIHTWSLGVEEQFYLLWPFLLLLATKLDSVGSQRSNFESQESRGLLVGLFFLLCFSLSLLLSFYWSSEKPLWAFYLMPSRIWQFSLGALVFLSVPVLATNLAKLNMSRRRPVAILIAGSGLFLILASGFALEPDIVYPGFWALIPSIGAALVIASNENSAGSAFPGLSHPVLVWFGDRSYSLYLWHWPVFMLGFSLGLQGQLFPVFCMIALCVFASDITYRAIELPFWKGERSKVEPHSVLLIGGLVIAVAIFISYHLLYKNRIANSVGDISNQWRNDAPVIYSMPCDSRHFSAEVQACNFGGGSTDSQTVVLFGDSNAAQWFSALPEIFQTPQWEVVVFTKSACPMVDEEFFYGAIGQIFEICESWRNAVIERIGVIAPDLLVLGSANSYPFDEEQWINGSVRILAPLSLAAQDVFLVPGTPELGFDGPACLSREFSFSGSIDVDSCRASDADVLSQSVLNYLGQAADRFSNVHLLDLNQLVCPQGRCRTMTTEGEVVFRDSNHLTDSFVRSLIPDLRVLFDSFQLFR